MAKRAKISSRLQLKRLAEKLPDLSRIEDSLREKGINYIAGVDEAGRGPLAGPVVAAAVILPVDFKLDGINDSKKLSCKKREELFEKIAVSDAIVTVGIIDNETIDKLNILRASLTAMQKAVLSLKPRPEFVVVDGSFTVPNLSIPQMAVVGGDALCQSVMAASIVAKVTRDRIMDKYEELYPKFSFSCHRGYSTPKHLEELKLNGPTEIHRKSFRPVVELLEKTLFD